MEYWKELKRESDRQRQNTKTDIQTEGLTKTQKRSRYIETSNSKEKRIRKNKSKRER